ncbi:MAG: recombinase family protein [Syntrophobacteraceae bacterium]|jgi:DNA invertase Pin-like site-specific DNA recombinase
MARVIGYLRVSTEEQDLEKFKSEILSFANQKRFGVVDWIEEKISGTIHWRKRGLGRILEQLQPGDVVIVNELSRFARSLSQIIEIMEFCKKRDISVFALKGSWSLDSSIESKVFLSISGMMSEIERDLISLRVKESLAAKRRDGIQLGRRKGPGKSRLDAHKPEIIALLRNGSTKSFVAVRYGVDPGTILNWLSKNQIDATPRVERVTA